MLAVDDIQARYGWPDDIVMSLAISRFSELRDITIERKNAEWVDNWQRSAFTAWAILSAQGLKISWEKYIANYGFTLKQLYKEVVTPEQKKKEINIGRAKAASIVALDRMRKKQA